MQLAIDALAAALSCCRARAADDNSLTRKNLPSKWLHSQLSTADCVYAGPNNPEAAAIELRTGLLQAEVRTS